MLALACAGTPPHQTALAKDFSVPLHIKPVGTVDISTASKIIHDSYRQQWEYAWTQLADVEVLEKAAVKITRRPKSAKLSTQDIQRLFQRNLIRRCDPTDINAYCCVFSVDEPLKHRRRWIVEPFLNDVLLDTVNFTLPNFFSTSFLLRQRLLPRSSRMFLGVTGNCGSEHLRARMPGYADENVQSHAG